MWLSRTRNVCDDVTGQVRVFYRQLLWVLGLWKDRLRLCCGLRTWRMRGGRWWPLRRRDWYGWWFSGNRAAVVAWTMLVYHPISNVELSHGMAHRTITAGLVRVLWLRPGLRVWHNITKVNWAWSHQYSRNMETRASSATKLKYVVPKVTCLQMYDKNRGQKQYVL